MLSNQNEINERNAMERSCASAPTRRSHTFKNQNESNISHSDTPEYSALSSVPLSCQSAPNVHHSGVQHPLVDHSRSSVSHSHHIDDESNSDTPLLYRTHSSVVNSYAAQQLRSMTDGLHSKSKNSIPDDHSANEPMDSDNSIKKEDGYFSPDINVPPKSPAIKIDTQSSTSNRTDVFGKSSNIGLSTVWSSSISNHSSIERARGVLSSYDESTGMEAHIFNNTHTSSIAASVELDMSSDFSSHFTKQDQFFNSTRLSLDFGQSNISLDSGPELKDLSELHGLSRIPLKMLTDSSNKPFKLKPKNSLMKQERRKSISRVCSDKVTDCERKKSRKLKNSSLRRVLSDTFDKCIHEESPLALDPSEALRSPPGSKVLSRDGFSPLSLTKKRSRTLESQFSSESDNSPEISVNTHTGLTPDLSQMVVDKDDDQRLSKAPRLDRKLYTQNLIYSLSESSQDHNESPTSVEIHSQKRKKNVLRHPSSSFIVETGSSQKSSIILANLESTGLTCDIDRMKVMDIVRQQKEIKISVTPPTSIGCKSDTKPPVSDTNNIISDSNIQKEGDTIAPAQYPSQIITSGNSIGEEIIPSDISPVHAATDVSPTHIHLEINDDFDPTAKVKLHHEVKEVQFLLPSPSPSYGSPMFSSPTSSVTHVSHLYPPQEQSTAQSSFLHKPLIMLKGILFPSLINPSDLYFSL